MCLTSHVGNMLTYKVEPEKERWGRYVVLDRSAVHIDNGTNQRLKEIRGKAKDSFPVTGIVWKEPWKLAPNPVYLRPILSRRSQRVGIAKH